MANGKKKTTKGKRNKNNANAAAARGRKGLPNDGLYYYRKGAEGRAARKKAIATGSIEQTPNRKKVRELQALKNKKASKAAQAQLNASSMKATAHGAGSKARRADLMKKADKLQKKADRKYKRVTGKSPVQMNGRPKVKTLGEKEFESERRSAGFAEDTTKTNIQKDAAQRTFKNTQRQALKTSAKKGLKELKKRTPIKMNAPITVRAKRR